MKIWLQITGGILWFQRIKFNLKGFPIAFRRIAAINHICIDVAVCFVLIIDIIDRVVMSRSTSTAAAFQAFGGTDDRSCRNLPVFLVNLLQIGMDSMAEKIDPTAQKDNTAKQ